MGSEDRKYSNYSSYLTGHFRVYEKGISAAVFDKIANVSYTGKQITPSGDQIKVYTDKKKTTELQENVDYTLSYGTNVKAGKGTVTVTGIGAYGGSKTVIFMILPKWLQWLL